MLQIKIISAYTATELTDKTNEFLATLETEAVKDIKVDTAKMSSVIHYEVKEPWKGQMCGDCKYWDDGGSPDAVSGLCHECGGRRRFNCRACKAFKDIRG